MKVLNMIIVGFIIMSCSYAEKTKNIFLSEDLGISMDVPVARVTKAPIYQIAMFFLPPVDGFAANINIQKHVFGSSIDAYVKLSISQLEQLGIKILDKKISENEATLEYKGRAQGKDLHWYAKAVKGEQSIYLVTATGLEKNWLTQKDELLKSVDSFKSF
jgi:hypothetical protein